MLGPILSTQYAGVLITNNSVLESDGDNGHQPSSLSKTALTRSFAPGGETVPGVATPKQKGLEDEITTLEEIERKLAAKYEICSTGKIDPVEVRQEAQVRAGRKTDINASSEWGQMHDLYHLRRELKEIQINGFIEPEAPPLPPKPSSSINGSRFWAVLIGIDAYPSSPLHGCVSDAKEMARYLTEYLLVPEDHIQCLLGHTPADTTIANVNQIDTKSSIPTRVNIIEALLGLSTNPRIHEGDNIVIYFAGHGCCYNGADFFRHDFKAALESIDALCPVDRVVPDKGVIIPDIGDREINTILSEIARTKGNRITFILDCSHSGGITRGVGGVRRIMPLPSCSIQDMFDTADKNLGHLPGYQSISKARWHPNMDSHVVLAACNDYECAMEVEGKEGYWHGVFTRALIYALKSVDLNVKSMTYYKLLATLPKNDTQHPVIAGKQRRSRLWFQEESDTAIPDQL